MWSTAMSMRFLATSLGGATCQEKMLVSCGGHCQGVQNGLLIGSLTGIQEGLFQLHAKASVARTVYGRNVRNDFQHIY